MLPCLLGSLCSDESDDSDEVESNCKPASHNNANVHDCGKYPKALFLVRSLALSLIAPVVGRKKNATEHIKNTAMAVPG